MVKCGVVQIGLWHRKQGASDVIILCINTTILLVPPATNIYGFLKALSTRTFEESKQMTYITGVGGRGGGGYFSLLTNE